MKSTGRHPEKALSAVQVRALKEPGRYADGNGLYLVVSPTGAKRWILRTVIHGKRSDVGLGGLSTTTLAEARDKAAAYRKLARQGGDPLAEKRAAIRETVPTFEEAARRVHAEHSPSWKNPKHAGQWINTLKDYVFPELGDKRIDLIQTPDILRALSPIWLQKPETARRVRQRIGTVLDWAKAAGYRHGDNPIDGVEKGLPKQKEPEEHHAALPYPKVPAFLKSLRSANVAESVRLAFEFLILTGTRTSEVLNATVSEVDLAESTWTIPAARMKAGREHRVPLAPRCIEILRQAAKLRGDSLYLFPGRMADKPLSNMAFLMTLRRMGVPVTAHGFRSSFRDWASEQTNFPRDVCEMALAHTIKDKVEAAYRRGDLYDKRRELMLAWALFVSAGSVEKLDLKNYAN